MKQRAVIFAVLALAALVAAFLVFRKKGDEAAKELPAAPPVPAPPVAVTPQNANTRILDPETGEGRAAILSRARSLYNSAEAPIIRANAGIESKLLAGVQYRNGMLAVLKDAVPDGNPYAVPIIPTWVSPSFKQRMDAIASTDGFENLTRSNGVDFAKIAWRGTLSLPEFGYSLWPSSLPQLIEAGSFGTPGQADRDRSERYDAFTTDVRRMAENMKKLSDDVGREFELRALQDLRGSGWKFIGFDQAN